MTAKGSFIVVLVGEVPPSFAQRDRGQPGGRLDAGEIRGSLEQILFP